jgi:fructuronate reductase
MAVACEPYRQWVIQDLFATARPPWEAAGAQFAADVRPFELAKLRLLNGAHSAIAYLGLAAGLDTVDQAMAQGWGGPLVRALAAEVAPTLPPGGPDPAAYADALVERFANPAIGHRLTQIGADGSLKIPERWLGALRQLRAAGRPAPTIELALAAWANATRPGQDTAQRFATADPKAAELAAAWSGSRQPVDGIGHLLAAVGAADLAQDRDLLERVAARLSQAAAWPGSPAGGAVRP